MKLIKLSHFVGGISDEKQKDKTLYITSGKPNMYEELYGFNEKEQLGKILRYHEFLNQVVTPQMFEGKQALFKHWTIEQNPTPEHNHPVLFYKGEPRFDLSFVLVINSQPATLGQIANNEAMCHEFFELTDYALTKIFSAI